MVDVIRVVEDGDRLVIAANGRSLAITRAQARILLSYLARALGYRVTSGRPLVRAVFNSAARTVRVEILEGSQVKDVAVPYRVLLAYLRAVNELGRGKHLKRELAERALAALAEAGDESARAFLADGRLNWEKLVGTRHAYYTLFRAPVLVLAEAGILSLGAGPSLRVLVAPVGEERLARALESVR